MKKDPLTKREREVYEYLAYSKETRLMMAESLGMAEDTLNIHLSNIRRKKNAVDTTDIVRTYFLEKEGLIEPETQRPGRVYQLPFVARLDSKVVSMSFETRKLKTA